jgi:hypothetical protein
MTKICRPIMAIDVHGHSDPHLHGPCRVCEYATRYKQFGPMRCACNFSPRRSKPGDAGLWAWDRRDGSVFVAPLVAATLARFGAMTAGRPPSNRAVFV